MKTILDGSVSTEVAFFGANDLDAGNDLPGVQVFCEEGAAAGAGGGCNDESVPEGDLLTLVQDDGLVDEIRRDGHDGESAVLPHESVRCCRGQTELADACRIEFLQDLCGNGGTSDAHERSCRGAAELLSTQVAMIGAVDEDIGVQEDRRGGMRGISDRRAPHVSRSHRLSHHRLRP